MDLRKFLLTYIGRGFEVETYICKGGLLIDGSLLLSFDGVNIPCPKLNKDEDGRYPYVDIKKTCFETVNPKTLNPPCENLINFYHRAKMPTKDIKKHMDELNKALPEPPEETPPTETPSRKQIEVESKVIMEDDPNEP